MPLESFQLVTFAKKVGSTISALLDSVVDPPSPASLLALRPELLRRRGERAAHRNGPSVAFVTWRLDGEAPSAAHGSDIEADGSGVLIYPRMYQLIRQEGPIGDRRFEIEFLERGAQAFAFTFG